MKHAPQGRFSARVFLVMLGAALCTFNCHRHHPPPPSATAPRYNIVLFLADDQPKGMLGYMPNVETLLVDAGVHFTSALATSPLCCPDRSSLLSGGYYAKNTGVLSIYLPNGSASRFVDVDTLGTRLQDAGYQTCLVGKYLNGYEALAPYVPPGWTVFRGLVRGSSEWIGSITTRRSDRAARRTPLAPFKARPNT